MTSSDQIHNLSANQRYHISGGTNEPTLIEIHHQSGLIDHVLLPFDGFLSFVVTAMDEAISIKGAQLSIRPAKRLFSPSRVIETEKILKKARFAAPICHGGCIYSMDRPRSDQTRQDLSDYRGMDLGSESLSTLAASQILLDQTPAFDCNSLSPVDAPNVAVVLHLHYPELWEEFANFLERSLTGFKLIVTVNEDLTNLTEAIRKFNGRAHVVQVQNLGRDVWPFLQILQSGLLDDVEIVLKLHGKRSILSGVAGSHFGHLWRRRNLCDLVGTPAQVSAILERFRASTNLGMLGSAPLLLPNGYGNDPGAKAAKELRERFSRQLEHQKTDNDGSFFAGTMFWARKEALSGLDMLRFSDTDFTSESAEDGVEHALERFFADNVRANNYQLGDIEPLTDQRKLVDLRSPSGRLTAPNGLFLAPNSAFRERWVRCPDMSDHIPIALIAVITPDGTLLQHTQRLMTSLVDQGYRTILCMACPDPSQGQTDSIIDADGLFLRDLGGFHFALWSAALRSQPRLWNAKELLLCTDAIVGDVAAIGITTAQDGVAYLSSYQNDDKRPNLISLGSNALSNAQVQGFLNGALSWNKESETLHRYDRRLLSVLEDDCGLGIERRWSNSVLKISELHHVPAELSGDLTGQATKKTMAFHTQRRKILRREFGLLFLAD